MPDWEEACQGKFQLLAAFLLCCIQLPITFTEHLLPLYGWSPTHRCRLPPVNASTVHARGWPVVDRGGRKVFDSCSMYVDPLDLSLGVRRCVNGWEYLHAEEDWTLVTEWDLVCEREYLLNLLPYAYTVGAMGGGLLFGALADHFGRRFNLLAALFLHTVLGLSLHFLTMFTAFAVGYSMQGVLVTAIQCVSFTLLLETIHFSSHLKAVACLCAVKPFGIITLSIVAWLIKNWRYIQLAISAPGIVCLGYFWLIPRSLPWLLSVGYASAAEHQLLQFARFNNVLLPTNFRQRVLSFCKRLKAYVAGSQHSLETVVCSDKIRRYTFILYYMWFVISLDSETFSSELPALKDNRYAALFVRGLMDTGMLILVYFFAQRFGPRSAHGSAMVIGGILCLCSVLIGGNTPLKHFIRGFKELSRWLNLISPVLSVVGKACIRSAFVTSIYFTLKVFPTGVRAIGLGSCLFWSRTARMVGIHVSTMETDRSTHFSIALYGFLSLVGGLLTPFLPTNTHRPLPNVALEIEKSLILDDSTHRRRGFLPPSLPPTATTTLDSNVLHFEPVDGHQLEKNNTILELSVRDFQSIVAPGPSGLCTSDKDDDDDAESRLTDLEDELNRIWELNGVQEEDTSHESLPESRRGDVREHYLKMNETRF